jgi:hypothetical protein
MLNNLVEDPLKKLDEVLEPDDRQSFMLGELHDYHKVLSEIKINNNVPVEVRQLFETAKNVSLYTYFVYRFHQVSEIVGYSALELAIKLLCEKDDELEEVPQGLSKLLFYAKKKKWLDNEYFDDLDESTIIGIKQKRIKQAEKELKKYGEVKQDPDREITEGDIRDGINKSLAVDGLIYLTLNFRNNLAHGSKMLYPSSMSMLEKTAGAINYIYRNQ